MVIELGAAGGAVDLRLRDAHPGAREDWRAGYVRRLVVTDIAVVSAAVAFAQLFSFDLSASRPLAWDPRLGPAATAFSFGIVAAWSILLGWNDSRATRSVGTGSGEYRRLLSATLHLFGIVAIVSLVLDIEATHDFLSLSLPLGLGGLTLTRTLWRGHAGRHRALGRYRHSVLVVGGPAAARAIAAAFSRDHLHGYHVVGVCTTTGPEPGQTITVGGRVIPIAGDDRSVVRAARSTGADTVVVMATDRLGPRDIRKLAWDLEVIGAELIVAPGVMDISGTRMSGRLLAGMPMVHIEKPRYDRALSLGKAVFDVCFAAVAVTLIAPALLIIATAVKLTSNGPVFYLSERIGMDGKPFRMIKFRSMYVHADRHVGSLIASNGGNPLFFKMKNDPRVTPVGRILRKYSLDELPQFFNVLRRDMSVVGPRPQVRREVHSYDGITRRRLLVRPGITGLWQVSGRSDLAPEESVELDISYVENWSMLLDLRIIVKTLRAVAEGEGAY
ncbi:sugar transferase [Nocardia bovistercoris]|uniref:Sugar transferase n=1 Tax=Nocardia bovistercoris TaxID=2785916 RepID=A0A931I612_9NOCA|nr:sugar transferase [Nocardia bovistercoris]MBH0774736.1 sugar transferase [Nocardia bovistercoris]